MPVRILIWNIRFFSSSVITKAGRGTKIIDTVQPAGAAPNYDIFIIIEPNRFAAPTNVGEVPQSGSSIQALQNVFYALRHRNAAWCAVPPRVLTTSNNKEVHGVFYFSTNVTLTGPANIAAPAPVALAALSNMMANVAVGLGALAVNAWGGAMAPAGAVRHSPDAAAATGAHEVVFDTAGSRRPYLIQFTAGGNAFRVYSHHAAPDANHPSNAHGIENMADVYLIGNGRVLPTLICGDFNCCPMHPACPNGNHYLNEIQAQNQLTGNQATRYRYWTDAAAAMDAAAALSDAYDNVQAAVAALAAVPANALAQAALVAAAQALAPPLLLVFNHATNINVAAGGPAAGLAGLLPAANNAHASLTGAVGGAVTAGNAAARALAGIQAAIAITDWLGANLNAPPPLREYAIAIHQTADAYTNIRAANLANAATAVNNVGAAVTTACNAMYQNLHVANHNAATAAAANATGVNAATPNLNVLAQTARNALRTLLRNQYKTHIIQTLTSLKTSSTARHGNYRNHAFDHILTNGFIATANADVLDRVALDGRNPGPAAPVNTFQAFYRRHYKGSGSGSRGISDHLPVHITVTV